MAVNYACDAGKESSKDKDEQLIERDVDTHGFGGNFIIADRGNGTAMLGTDKICLLYTSYCRTAFEAFATSTRVTGRRI